jgi:hypothetical protein
MNATEPKYDDDGRVLDALRAPFETEALSYYPRTVNHGDSLPNSSKNGNAVVLVYVDARAVRRRLTTVLGAARWEMDLEAAPFGEEGGFVGTIDITLPSGTTIHRSDAAGLTDIEAIKGAASDAQRRLAVNVGVGEYLYDLKEIKVPADTYESNGYEGISQYDEGIRDEHVWAEMPDRALLVTNRQRQNMLGYAGKQGLSREGLGELIYSADAPYSSLDEIPMSGRAEVKELIDSAA